jgi:hypothetical protein
MPKPLKLVSFLKNHSLAPESLHFLMWIQMITECFSDWILVYDSGLAIFTAINNNDKILNEGAYVYRHTVPPFCSTFHVRFAFRPVGLWWRRGWRD